MMMLLTSSPHSLFGTPMVQTSSTADVDNLVVDFLRIDVDPAGDDDLCRAAREKQIVVLVEEADTPRVKNSPRWAPFVFGVVLGSRRTD